MATPARTRRDFRDLAVGTVLALLSGLACWFIFDVDSFAAWLPGIPFAVAACVAAVVAWRPAPVRLIAAAVVIALAWDLAYWMVQESMDPIGEAIRFVEDSNAREQLGIALSLNVGSLIGGALSLLALGLAAGRFMAARFWLVALAAAALVCFVAVYVVAGAAMKSAMFLFLFPAWQIVILFTALWGTARGR
jgi:hypothetical protein